MAASNYYLLHVIVHENYLITFEYNHIILLITWARLRLFCGESLGTMAVCGQNDLSMKERLA